MKRFERFMSVFLCMLVLMLFIPSPSNAANPNDGVGSIGTSNVADKQDDELLPNSGDIVPEEKKDENSKSMFQKYGRSALILDYKTSFKDTKKSLLKQIGIPIEDYLNTSFLFHTLNALLWQLYLIAASFFVKWISWGFNMVIITHILTAYKSAMESLATSIWDPMIYLMSSVAVAWMVYYWISGKKTMLWTTLLNSILIIALSTSIFMKLPNFLRDVSNASADVSTTILTGLMDKKIQKKISKNLAKSSAKDRKKMALDIMEESLDGIFIDLPYMLINFGSPELAKQIPWENVLNPPLGKSRNEVLQDTYDKWVETGNCIELPNGMRNLIGEKPIKEMKKIEEPKKCALRDKMKWMTADKAPERLGNSIIIIVFSLIAMICFVYIAFLTIIWQFIALGRGLLAAVYLLISLWPGYGMKEAATWGWSMIQALFMKVFYTIILAVYIIMVTALSSKTDEIGFLNIWLLAIGLFVGLKIALSELRTKLSNIPLGNGIFLQGTTNEAEQGFGFIKRTGEKAFGYGAKTLGYGKKALGYGAKALGYGTAITGAVTGNQIVARSGLAIARKGVGGAIEQEGYKALNRVAERRKDSIAEKKEQKAAERAYQDRVDGLLPEDAAFANYVRNTCGIDVTTSEGQAKLGEVAPDFAKNNTAALSRIGENTLSREMARQMPRNVPPPGSLEHKLLSQKFGEENVERWREAQSEVDGRLQAYKKLSTIDKATIQKPKTDRAAVQKQFEKIQNKNALGKKVLADFKNQVANSGSVVIDLNQMGSIGSMGSIGEKSLQVKVTGNLKQHLPDTAAETQKVMESVRKQIADKLRAEGIQANKMNKPIKVKIDMPVGGNGTFGTQKVDLVLDRVNTSGSSAESLDPEILRNQIKKILASVNKERSITPPPKIDLAATFVGKFTDVLQSATKVENELQRQLNFIESNTDVENISDFAASDKLNKLLREEFDSFEKQIRKMQQELGLQANNMTSSMKSFQADVQDVIATINKMKKDVKKS
ncbi:hypothetical protein MK805_04310 [Shimazuella sp. AN120528]|uniref:hypothetical protein n=1 Tax=Shimazuella soli TaxID=1892854 RepID=UPI001F0F66C2|nr:hypothetical protein [Shimazuella soli]MCH5584190.1 hypothetical protein [Shimazuella soli]